MPPSTRAIGLAFENHTLRFLNDDLRMSLRQVGGKSDGGVDLRGLWWIPKLPRRRASAASGGVSSSKSTADTENTVGESDSASSSASTSSKPWKPPIPPGLKRDGTPGARIRPLHVLAQCKAERRVQGPNVVREFEGTLGHLAAQDTRVQPLGILSSQSGFTLGAMQHAVRSKVPLMLLHLEGGRPAEEEVEDPELSSASASDSCEEGAEGSELGAPTVPVTGAWWNGAFGAHMEASGIELRREIHGQQTRVGVWTAGTRMGRYGPPL